MNPEADPIQELKSKTAIIILAAGSSSRMGTPKQLLEVDDTVLLKKAAVTALSTGVCKVCVVLGSNESEHRKAIGDLKAEIIFNPDWTKGMGSSVKTGVNAVLSTTKNLQAIVFMVCDQPLLTTHHLNSLIEQRIKNDTGIVASSYSGMQGVPVLFSEKYFPALNQLNDQHGAKKIIDQNLQDVSSVIFSGGEIDLDTIEDYQKYITGYSKRDN